MAKKVTGRFYFKRTTNHNLIGEFSNNIEENIFTESADLISAPDGFRGSYLSTWQENGSPCFAELTISFRANTPNRIYTLTWKRNGNSVFEGEGMLCDDILIGDYRGV